MPRPLRRAALAALALALPAVFACAAHASTVVGGPFLGKSGYYDYSDSGIRDDAAGLETHWWCGDLPSHVGDTILQEQWRTAGGAVTLPERQVLAEGPAGSWDAAFTCNPTVVQGDFTDPFGDGANYTYAMYYVGTAQTNGHDNSIGAAFSNDGGTWRKFGPVLTFPDPDPGHVYYGYAQPNAAIVGGRVQVLFEDWDAPAAPSPGPLPTGRGAGAQDRALSVPGRPPVAHTLGRAAGAAASVGTHWYALANPDGVTFASPALVTAAGLPSPTPSWGGAAYNPGDGRWYAAFNQDDRPASTTGGVQENGQSGITLYATGNLDTGVWTQLDTLDTVTTGSESNFIAGLLRNPDGALASAFLPGVQVDLSQSFPRPAYNASGAALGDSGAFNDWQISWNRWAPGQPWRVLQRVVSGTWTHEVTTGWWDTGAYRLEGSLGKLAEAPTGTATVPLYGCKAGATDYFVSPGAGCEGQYKAGLEGYAYSTPAADRSPLYRCVSGAGHFVSTDPHCEGQSTEGLLGYSQN